MKQSWIIARRELNSFFDSLIAYLILIVFLGFTGLFTWLYGSDIFMRKEADLRVFFDIALWTLFFFIPAITMKMIAEEKRSGTMELLLTKAVNNWQVVSGKFIACFLLITIALVCTLPYYITVSSIGEMDHGATIAGYIGLLLMSGAYIGIGIFASSVTHNQIAAFILALFIGIFFQFIFGFMAQSSSGLLGEIFSTLDLQNHIDSISRGVLDTKDIIYFISLALMGMFLSEWMISKR